ncbi:hypothetical protein [Rhodococcus sp. NPDC058514]|uniref:hypothetical protein n=1 Tax=unclassified Rhodococcus (in: high G+C Gram-positive bacteria) TaxID=192944 RepID=UPI003649DB90
MTAPAEPAKSTRASRRVVRGAVVGALIALGLVAVNRLRAQQSVTSAHWDDDPIGPDDLAG